MARFKGTIQEFYKFIEPRIRNVINTFAKMERLKHKGICQHCNDHSELQSTHIHGRERRAIIDQVLSRFNSDGLIDCDLVDVENRILNAHNPISETFLFLCHKCHRIYDATAFLISIDYID